MLFAVEEAAKGVTYDQGLVYVVATAIIGAMSLLWAKITTCEKKHDKCDEDNKIKGKRMAKMRVKMRMMETDVATAHKKIATLESVVAVTRGEAVNVQQKSSIIEARVDNISRQQDSPGVHKSPTDFVQNPNAQQGTSDSEL
jgi:hypothetical protein